MFDFERTGVGRCRTVAVEACSSAPAFVMELGVFLIVWVLAACLSVHMVQLTLRPYGQAQLTEG